MKAYWDFPRSVSSTRAMLELASRYGLNERQCLEGSAIDPRCLQDPLATVAASQELQVIRNLLRQLGPALPLGLELGVCHHPTSYGIWGYAVLSSQTFVSAVSVGLRYLQLTSTYCRIIPMVRGEEALLVVDGSELPEDVRDFLVESTLATLITIQFDLDRANLPVRTLRLRRSRPAYAGRFRELFAVEPTFGQDEDSVAIDAHRLLLKLPQGNPLTRQFCEQECQRLLRQRRQLGDFAGQVRDRLARDPAAMPTMPLLAAEMGLHVRTLRRRLAGEGVAYEGLVDEVRSTLAEELLKVTSLSLEEVAQRLGYSEPPAFTRAFRRWHGMPPSVYRAGLVQSLGSGCSKA